jgi:hypothetical protein
MLSAKQNFRLGFLQKCADAGMTAAEATQLAERATQILRMHKAASTGGASSAAPSALTLAGLGSMLFDNPVTAGVGELSRTMGGYAIPAAMAAPPVIGALTGHLLARSTDVDDETIKAIRKREMISEIRRNRQLLEQKRRTYRPTA